MALEPTTPDKKDDDTARKQAAENARLESLRERLYARGLYLSMPHAADVLKP